MKVLNASGDWVKPRWRPEPTGTPTVRLKPADKVSIGERVLIGARFLQVIDRRTNCGWTNLQFAREDVTVPASELVQMDPR